jgi:hypothetical protein
MWAQVELVGRIMQQIGKFCIGSESRIIVFKRAYALNFLVGVIMC